MPIRIDPIHVPVDGKEELDLAITPAPPDHDELETERLGALPNRICAAPGHPLAERRPDAASSFENIAFVGPGEELEDGCINGWPPHIERRIRVTSSDPHLDTRLCRRGGVLAVLPGPFLDEMIDETPDETASEGTLVTWGPDFLDVTPVYAVRRRKLVDDDLVGSLIGRLKSRLE